MPRNLEEVLVPGEILGVIEEFIPCENVYVVNGFIKSLVLGMPLYNIKEHVVSVKPLKDNKPLVPRLNDVVYSQVVRIRENVAFTSIFEIEGRGCLQVPFTGILHVSQVSTSYVKTIYDAVRIGDVVRARIVSRKGPPFHISTRGKDMGVVYALCPICVKPLKKRGVHLSCPSCRRVSKRKISELYALR